MVYIMLCYVITHDVTYHGHNISARFVVTRTSELVKEITYRKVPSERPPSQSDRKTEIEGGADTRYRAIRIP